MTPEELKELAAANALNALDGTDVATLERLLAENIPDLKTDVTQFNQVARLLAHAPRPTSGPSPELRTRILQAVKDSTPPQPAPTPDIPGFAFIRGQDPSGWLQLATPGATAKLLSTDPVTGYSVVLGKLAPGTRYPSHTHRHAEDIYVLSGDLYIGDTALHAGDFHHADAGTRHPVNRSETGCTILAYVSTEDLQAQLA